MLFQSAARRIGITWVFLLLASGCGMSNHIESMDRNSERMASQIEQDQQYLKTVSEQMKRMTDNVEQFQLMARDMTRLLGPAQPVPPGQPALPGQPAQPGAITPPAAHVPSLDEILGGSTPPSTPPTSPAPAVLHATNPPSETRS